MHLSVYSECNYKVLRLGSPEADQGQTRSLQGQWDSAVCVCVLGLGEVDGERDASGP